MGEGICTLTNRSSNEIWPEGSLKGLSLGLLKKGKGTVNIKAFNFKLSFIIIWLRNYKKITKKKNHEEKFRDGYVKNFKI